MKRSIFVKKNVKMHPKQSDLYGSFLKTNTNSLKKATYGTFLTKPPASFKCESKDMLVRIVYILVYYKLGRKSSLTTIKNIDVFFLERPHTQVPNAKMTGPNCK